VNDIPRGPEFVAADSEDLSLGIRIRPIAWEQFTAELLALYEPPLRAAATRRQMKHYLELAAAAGVKTTADLTPAAIARVIACRPPGEAPRTTAAVLRCLRVAANVAVRSGYLMVSPFSIRPVGAWVRVGAPAPRRHLSHKELSALLAHLKAECDDGRVGWARWKSQRLYGMAATAAYAGLRASELFHLEVADIALAERIISVHPRVDHKLKTTRSAQPVPICDALAGILEAWLAVRLSPPTFPPPDQVPWLWPGCRGRSAWMSGPSDAKPVEVLAAAANRAGIEGVTWQVLRRSLATALAGSGVPGATVARILRHSERVSELFYQQTDRDTIRKAVDGLVF
jgi:integrase